MSRERKDQSLFRGHGPPPPDGGEGSGQSPAHLAPALLWKAALAGGVQGFSPAERRHFTECPTCQMRFEQVVAAVQSAAAGVSSADHEPDEIEEPAREQSIHR